MIRVLTSGIWIAFAGLMSAAPLTLVQDGEPRAVIVMETPDDMVNMAAEELREYVFKASGAQLPILEAEAKTEDAQVVIRIGDGPKAKSLGIDSAKLDVEQFRIKTDGNQVIIVGRDQVKGGGIMSVVNKSPATVWGVEFILDHFMGVRWLWPGDLGTVIPKMKTIQIPDLDVTWQPACEHRELPMRFNGKPGRTGPDGSPALLTNEEQMRVVQEANRWLERQRMGVRKVVSVSHSFEGWWEKYSSDHPDLFAKPPPGFPLLYDNKPGFMKLCNSNPKVIQFMIKEWRAAGSPDMWGAAPNDGAGYCVCDNCLAMDGTPAGQNLENVYRGKTNLTIRHVKWWNQIMKEFRALKPNIRFRVISYGAYKKPPPENYSLDKNYIVSNVSTYADFSKEEWKSWQRGGCQMVLRPNWWHSGSLAPNLTFRGEGGFFKFAQANGMIGFRFDELKGTFGAQGINYYTIARLNVRPELSIDDILYEYLSAFGSAREVVGEYMKYWEDFTERSAYPLITGGYTSQGKPSLYEMAVKQHKIHPHPLVGSFQVLPYIFTDDVVNPAFAILDRADEAARQDPPEIRERIKFLRDGLKHTVLTRDTVALGRQLKTNKSLKEAHIQSYLKLRAMRKEFTFRHVIWGDNDFRLEERFNSPSYPRGYKADDSMEGM